MVSVVVGKGAVQRNKDGVCSVLLTWEVYCSVNLKVDSAVFDGEIKGTAFPSAIFVCLRLVGHYHFHQEGGL